MLPTRSPSAPVMACQNWISVAAKAEPDTARPIESAAMDLRIFTGVSSFPTDAMRTGRCLPRRARVGAEWSGTIGRKCDGRMIVRRSEEHTSELQSRETLVCRFLLEKTKHKSNIAACHHIR